ncbi:MAG: ribonuclease HI family protein [Deltaproteobacteria bacterium]|nr:ribonuclease HI family protein [Deltaproteobacteria bacterium]MBI3017283.1 ribonuclease HI family protein [Deltaproteobacteria bacterium]
MKVQLYIDGASRGNPGLGGAGAYMADEDGNEILRLTKYLGTVTNNMAEYAALLLGLKEAKKRKFKEILIFSDSELLVRQVQGVYQVKNAVLKKNHEEVMNILRNFNYKISHVRREKNKIADQLANEAIDQALEK